MKVVIIGAGSYVFAPGSLVDLLEIAKRDCELVLVDLDGEAARRMAEIARIMARENGVKVTIHATDNRREALQGADHITLSVATEGLKRWQMDYEILKDEGIASMARENGAMGGLIYALRSNTLVMSICEDIARICPRAVIHNSTNPLARVGTCIHEFTDLESYGYCSGSLAGKWEVGYSRLARILDMDVKDVDALAAGINHFSWIGAVTQISTSKDLLPLLIDKLEEKSVTGGDLKFAYECYREYGMVPALHYGHFSEFLPTQEGIPYHTTPPFHGDLEDRANAIRELEMIAEGKADYHEMSGFKHLAWEHPLLYAVAMYDKQDYKPKPAVYMPINMPNSDSIVGMPRDAIADVPAVVEKGEVVSKKGIVLPPKVLHLCNMQAMVNHMTAVATMNGDRALCHDIIDFDPSIESSRSEAHKALNRLLAAHADILPQFA